MAIDWRRGMTASYYATIVDPDSWADVGRIDLVGGSIKRETSGLRHSADIDCVNYDLTDQNNQPTEKYIRVWLDARQGASFSHTALFTGLASSPGFNIEGRTEKQTLQCYSVLKPAQDVLLEPGYYVPIGVDGGKIVKRLLDSCLKAPVDISTREDEKRTITSSIVAESGETVLSMVEIILEAMSWRIQINGHGDIFIGPYNPYNEDAVATFDSIDNDVIETTVSINYDWYDCPNVVRAIVDDNVAIAKDEDENSPFSIVSRGREVWYEETNCVLNDKENLVEYARRRLKELQQVSTIISYDRRFNPDVFPTDVVQINYPIYIEGLDGSSRLINIEGRHMVTSQSITLGYSAKTSEEVIQL